MAKEGENYVKEMLEAQDFKTEKLGKEDIFAFKDILGIVIEEKDWKDPIEIFKNNIYVRAINGRRYRQKRSQVVNYGYKIKKQDMEKGIYRYIICAYVVSNLVGRKVYPIYFRKFGTIFVVHKAYLTMWLKSLERTYIGEKDIYIPSMYMGGK